MKNIQHHHFRQLYIAICMLTLLEAISTAQQAELNDEELELPQRITQKSYIFCSYSRLNAKAKHNTEYLSNCYVLMRLISQKPGQYSPQNPLGRLQHSKLRTRQINRPILIQFRFLISILHIQIAINKVYNLYTRQFSHIDIHQFETRRSFQYNLSINKRYLISMRN